MQIAIFLLATVFFIRVSWQSFKNPGTHGFYRFFVFEGVAALVLINQPYWFEDPFSLLHSISWFCLAVSILFIVQSLWMLIKKGGNGERDDMPANFTFENTAYVVDVGLYRYIRHPMYSSLLFLALGAYCKNISYVSSMVMIAVSFFVFIAAQVEEGENIRFFGERYRDYMKRSKMFIPLLL